MNHDPATDRLDEEPVLEPDLEIVDPHHHLWDRRGLLASLPPPRHPFETIVPRSPVYLLDELLGDLGSGHKVVATVYVECGSMYRAEGPSELKCVGETEFVNGVAAMTASGGYGPVLACQGIVGHVDMTSGAKVGKTLDAHVAAGGGRFRGVRHSASFDADPNVLGPLVRAPEGLYRSAAFREGFAELEPLGLSFDAWLLEPQIGDLVSLADAFPKTAIVLDHVGTPLGLGRYAGRREERFEIWRSSIRALAERGNVVIKLGGLAMPFAGFPIWNGKNPPSEHLADLWRPFVETCIEAFGPERCMFESNYPVDKFTASYRVLWNALKRLASGCSSAEKALLFRDTARRVYRLPS